MTLATSDTGVDVPIRAADGGKTMGWAEALVSDRTDTSLLEIASRIAAGLGLASLYGLALGARQGGRALVQHAFGVPLALLLIAVVGAPSLFVFLSMCRAKIDPWAMANAMGRGVASAGLLLAGLAPAAALFVVSSETPPAAAAAVIFGLVLSGAVALGRTLWEIMFMVREDGALSNLATLGISAGFAVFAVALAVRIWSAALPVLGGVS
jgi:hypothetical protein